MKHHSQKVMQQLVAIEKHLRTTERWNEECPDAKAFESQQPFALDTMEPVEWLQWVLLPNLTQLIERDGQLPAACNISPYFEEALPEGHDALIVLLKELDALFNQGSPH